jgi:hypothetical protein
LHIESTLRVHLADYNETGGEITSVTQYLSTDFASVGLIEHPPRWRRGLIIPAPDALIMVDSADNDVDATGDDDGEWRYSIDDVGSEVDDVVDEEAAIEPESISLEHATFVALGVLLTVGVVVTGL